MGVLLTCVLTLTVGAPEDGAVTARPAIQTGRLMSANKEARLRGYLPNVVDENIARIFDDPELMLYTDAEMPKAYQLWSGDLPGVHLASYNISADNSEPFGNGNREFPWATPAGTQRAKNVSTFRFLWLPKDEQGKHLPVVWHRQRFSGDSSTGYSWTFPVGAILGEVLSMKGPDGYGYTFETRLRIREVGHWEVEVLRPFPTARELAARIKELRPNWEKQANLVKFCRHLEAPIGMKVHTLADRQPGRRTFHQKMGIDNLPSLGDDKLVTQLLTTTPFRSAVGLTWRDEKGVSTCAPTTSAAFHIVPASYDAGFVAADNQSCMRCHNTVTESVDKFNGGRDWYGRIRGSDGIFSFHPFALGSLSGSGIGSKVQIRPELQRSGRLALFNKLRHPRGLYHALRKSR